MRGAVRGHDELIGRARSAKARSAKAFALQLWSASVYASVELHREHALEGTADPRTADLITVQGDVTPGSYLVRVQMNGVASRLSFNVDPASPSFNRYDGPRVEVA